MQFIKTLQAVFGASICSLHQISKEVEFVSQCLHSLFIFCFHRNLKDCAT